MAFGMYANQAVNAIKGLYMGGGLRAGAAEALRLASEQQWKEAGKRILQTGGNYLWTNASTPQKIARIGATWAGLNILNRYRKGGNMLNTEYGARDIAGIPLI